MIRTTSEPGTRVRRATSATPDFAAWEQMEARIWAAHFAAPPSASRKEQTTAIVLHGAVALVSPQTEILAFNRVIGLGTERPADLGLLDELLAQYRYAGVRRCMVQLSPYARPSSLARELRARGGVLHNHWIKLLRPLQSMPASPGDARVELVGPERLPDFHEVLAQSFGWTHAEADFARPVAGMPGWKQYLACVGGVPAAAAELYVERDTAALVVAGTRPEYRGQGLQTALIQRRLLDAWVHGCRWALVETAEELPGKPCASFRNMLRTGFRPLYPRPNFVFTF